MSVLIKGMEMPTLYKTYKVRFAETNDGKVVVGIADENSTAYRPLGEVIPVPPHGALMDRDDFFATCPELVDGYKRITDDLVVIPAEEGE